MMAHLGRSHWDHPKPDYARGGWADQFSNAIRKAPPGWFRVIAEDHKYYDDDYPIAEYSTEHEAVECAGAHDSHDEWFFVYNDAGRLIWSGEGKTPRH